MRVVSAAAPYLAAEFVDANFAFYGTTLSGTPRNKDRWKRGVAVVEAALGEAVGQIYVARHFPETHKARMQSLVANLIEAYRQSITGLAWMGEETKLEALKKLESFRAKIGYPEKWIDYSAVEIDPADLLGNVERAHNADVDRHLDEVGKPVDREKWLMTPQTVNAYYHPLLNEIVFPAAILQPPFFTADADDAVNYGGIGAVIGHEIGHGFDDQGSQYDGSGLLRNWWTEDDRTAFEALTSKLVAQFDALSPTAAPGHHVNGKLTLGENIGDLGGLTIAYKAYLISLDGAGAARTGRPDRVPAVLRVLGCRLAAGHAERGSHPPACHGPALPQRVPHQRDSEEPRRVPCGLRRHRSRTACGCRPQERVSIW